MRERIADVGRHGWRMATAMAAATFWSAAGGVSAEPAMQARFFEQAALAQSNAVALEGAWMKAALREGKAEVLSLSLDKALQNQEFLVQILRTKLIGPAAQGWTPRLNRAVHEVDVQSYETQAEGGGTRIRVKANVVFRFDGDMLGQQAMGGAKEVAGALTLDLEAKAGGVTGNYALDGGQGDQGRLRSVKGKVTGSLAEVSTPPAPNAVVWMPSSKDGVADLYELATVIEKTADAWYQRLRALEIARRMNRAYAETLSDVVFPRIVRPAIKFGGGSADAGSDGDVGGGASDDLLDDLGVTKTGNGKGGTKDGGKGGAKDGGKGGAKAGSDAELQAGLTAVRSIASRVARMARLAEGLGQDGAQRTAEGTACYDPEFGPWYGDGFLPAKDGVTRLPAEIGGPGAQEWQAVIDWQCLGPFPLSPFDASIPGLPDMVWGGDESCVLQADRLTSKTTAEDPFVWQGGKAKGISKDLTRGVFGYVMPPRWFATPRYTGGITPMLGYREYQGSDGHGGQDHSTCYARCVIESPRDLEVWAGLGVNREGRLWVDERLVWQGPAHPVPGAHERVALIRLPLRKGLNRLVLRVDVDHATAYWWLRLCLRGEPRPAAEVKAKAEAVAALHRQFKPDPAVGWRGDGTGTTLPGCNPPVAWNQKTKQNVLWSVPMPSIGSGNAVPAPGTNRLFVGLDPHWLLCLDKDTGKELWRRPVTMIDLLDDAERTKGRALVEDWWQAMMDRSSMPLSKVGGNYYTGFPKWLHYQRYWAEETGIWTPAQGSADDERKGASPELIALLDKRDELQKAEDPVSVQEQLSKVLKDIEKEQAKTSVNDPDSRQAKEARFAAALNALWGFMSKHVGKWCYGGSAFGYWPDYVPWMYPTPVTDGKHVWVKSGFMAAACFDMDGTEIWKVALEGTGIADKILTSPRLVDGKLIMQVHNPEREGGSVHGGIIRLIALDAATGKKVWSAPVYDYNWNAATPAVLRLTDGRETMSVLVTPEGSVVRADDGKVLVRDSGSQCCFDSPLVVDGDTVVFGHGGLSAVQFIMKSRDQVGCRRLWAQRGNEHGMLNCGGAVAADGRVYFTSYPKLRHPGGDGSGEPGTVSTLPPPGASECWKTMVAHDLSSGLQVARLLALRKGGNQYSPGSVSDRHVYQIDGDHIFVGSGPKAPMDMVVVTRGENPLRLANNPIDRTYGSGIIEGDRIYIRGYHYVTCIGYTGDDGRRYQARTVARNLMDEVYAGRPGDSPVVTVPMVETSTINLYTYQHPRNIYRSAGHCVLTSGYAPHRYWILGPVPRGQAAAVLAASGGPTKPVAGDEVVNVEGQQYGWGPLYQTYLKVAGFKSWELDPANFADIHRLRQVIDLNPVLRDPKGPVTVFLFTDLKSEVEQTMRFEQTEPGIRAWVGGKEVRHGERIRFGKGFCRLFLEVTVEAPAARGPFISPRFWASEDVKRETSDWEAAVKRRRPYFEEVIRVDSDSVEAASARKLLAETK